MKNQKGFSLVELLVVVIIIAIIAAIAIPNLLASRRAANEASAVSSLRSIHSAEATYQATSGANTAYGTLAELNTAGLIDSVLSAATASATPKSGYFFTESTVSGGSSYCVVADPVTQGLSGTGVRNFAVSGDGVIYQSSADGTTTLAACAGDPLQASGAGPLN